MIQYFNVLMTLLNKPNIITQVVTMIQYNLEISGS